MCCFATHTLYKNQIALSWNPWNAVVCELTKYILSSSWVVCMVILRAHSRLWSTSCRKRSFVLLCAPGDQGVDGGAASAVQGCLWPPEVPTARSHDMDTPTGSQLFTHVRHLESCSFILRFFYSKRNKLFMFEKPVFIPGGLCMHYNYRSTPIIILMQWFENPGGFLWLWMEKTWLFTLIHGFLPGIFTLSSIYIM